MLMKWLEEDSTCPVQLSPLSCMDVEASVRPMSAQVLGARRHPLMWSFQHIPVLKCNHLRGFSGSGPCLEIAVLIVRFI